MSVSISHSQSCTERSQKFHVISSAIGGEVAAHRNLLSRTMLFGQGLFLQNFYFPNPAKRDDRFFTAYGHIVDYILPFAHNTRNFTGKGGMARDNATRYGLYRKVVKYHLRLGVWRAAWYIVRFIICLVVLSEIVLSGYWSICTKIPVMPPRDGAFRKSN